MVWDRKAAEHTAKWFGFCDYACPCENARGKVPQGYVSGKKKANGGDMGIYLFMLETCLEHENYSYDRVLYADTTDDSVEKTLVAKYEFHSETIERK